MWIYELYFSVSVGDDDSEFFFVDILYSVKVSIDWGRLFFFLKNECRIEKK